jgi:hypothetical protein
VELSRNWRMTCSPLRFAPVGMRELSSELLVSPPLRSGENQEFEQMPLRGTAQLAHWAGDTAVDRKLAYVTMIKGRINS